MDQETLDRSPPTFLDRICADLLLCQKNIAIYPREHPRVSGTIEDIRRAISERVHGRDEPYVSLETLLIEDLANSGIDSPSATENYAALSRVLKLHLIEEVRFQPPVSHEELYQFSSLLQEDFFEASDESLDRFDPCSWRSIQLWFYTPQDFPDDLPAGETLLGRAAGLRRSEEVDRLLKEAPPMLASRIRQAIVKPVFLRKISELRRKLRETLSADNEGEDLIASIVKRILPDLSGVESASGEEILMAVDDYIHTVEVDVAPAVATAAEQLRPQVADSDFDILPLHHMPREGSATQPITDLRRVFGVSLSGEVTRELPAEEEKTQELNESAPPPLPRPLRNKGSSHDDDSLNDLFREIQYDGVAWRETLRHHDQLLQFLRVVLEVLLTSSGQNVISRHWTQVLESLAQHMNEMSFMERVVKEVVEFSTRAKLPAGEELLSLLLEAIGSTPVAYGVLEERVIPESQSFATRVLDRLIERRPKRALGLLMRLHRHASPKIHKHAEAALISLSKNAGFLESWAREYPGGLVDPSVFSRIVEREDPEYLIATFKEFFIHTPPEISLRLLRLITADLPGVDYILITAIQFGPPEVHDHALSFLADSCIPVVTGTLVQTVRLNNYQEHPSMREVEAALDALIRIDEPRAKQFIEDVATSRSGWLRYEYRREIRDALKKILDRQEKS